ncbi:MAG: RNase adapter RapZ [Actinomycetaceae bacterium]|nr:RNase adapter RapZ [Actinomycetaceae bacterium]
MAYNRQDTGTILKIVSERDEIAELPEPEDVELLLITGMSGAGRTRVADTLEDLDWYVVDNLPPSLLISLLKVVTPATGITKFAAVVDVRSREFFDDFENDLRELEKAKISFQFLFLDCNDDELVRRYESVRRPHPLAEDGRLLDGIRAERELLGSLKEQAHIVIDTTKLSVHDLARKVRALVVGENVAPATPKITVTSFGFKYGVPLDADNMIDVRFLANPYWVSELRHLTGRDKEVSDYVLTLPGAEKFVDDYTALMDEITKGYARELKPFVNIAVGCTGGKHRSVAIAEAIADKLRDKGLAVRTIHRDLGKE